MRRPLAQLSWALLSLASCRNLPDIESNVCGNAVLEEQAGEACDTFPSAPDLVCRPAGVLGECQHDCSLRGDGSRPGCPSGYGCGADGICREETSGFEAAQVPLYNSSSSWLSAADFDGDEQVEVLSAEPADSMQQARFRLHYFGRDGSLVETRTFPRLTTRPIARDVDGDARDELIFSNLRIGMLPGRADREWVPSAFSSYVVPGDGLFVLGVAETQVASATPLVAVAAIEDVRRRALDVGLFVPDFHTRRLEPRGLLPRPLDELAGPPVAGDLFEGPDSPCRELVLAFRGDDRVYVYDMCTSSADEDLTDLVWRPEAVMSSAELPPDATVDAAPLVADVDGDGHLDVVVGSSGRSLWIKGSGQALAPVAEELHVLFEEQLGGQVDTRDVWLPMPLAIGELSGDGVADFVMPEGVLSSYTRQVIPGIRYTPSVTNRGTPWTTAKIEDVNGNGLLDVVTASAGQPGLNFLNGTGRAVQIFATLPTRGPVQHLTAGDFDGDLIGDVAFIEEAASDATQFLAVAFGAPDATPALSHQVAQLSPVDQLAAGSEGGFDHLWVTSRQRRGTRQLSALTMFDGNSDRLPFAPYSLVEFAEDLQVLDSYAIALVVGQFTRSGAADVLAIGSRQDLMKWDTWLVPNIGQHEQLRLLQGPDPDAAEKLLPLEQRASVLSLRVAGAAADIDGDGLDEALWLMPDRDGQCTLLIQEIDAAASRAEHRDVVRFDERCPEPAISAVDLDGEDHPDLLLLMGDAEDAPRRILVLWNDERGAFSKESATVIGAPDGTDITAFHAFPVLKHDEPGRRVAFVSESGLWVAAARATRQHPSYEAAERIQKLDRARAIVVADPNSDNVPDILVADADGLWLLRAKLR